MCLFIETLRIEDGKVWHAPLHDRRLNDTRRAFFGSVPDLHVTDYLRPEAYTERTRCRLTYARDVVRVEYFPYRVRPVHRLQLVVRDDADYRYKRSENKAARFHYQRILDEYEDTPFAPQATEMLSKLEGRPDDPPQRFKPLVWMFNAGNEDRPWLNDPTAE